MDYNEFDVAFSEMYEDNSDLFESRDEAYSMYLEELREYSDELSEIEYIDSSYSALGTLGVSAAGGLVGAISFESRRRDLKNEIKRLEALKDSRGGIPPWAHKELLKKKSNLEKLEKNKTRSRLAAVGVGALAGGASKIAISKARDKAFKVANPDRGDRRHPGSMKYDPETRTYRMEQGRDGTYYSDEDSEDIEIDPLICKIANERLALENKNIQKKIESGSANIEDEKTYESNLKKMKRNEIIMSTGEGESLFSEMDFESIEEAMEFLYSDFMEEEYSILFDDKVDRIYHSMEEGGSIETFYSENEYSFFGALGKGVAKVGSSAAQGLSKAGAAVAGGVSKAATGVAKVGSSAAQGLSKAGAAVAGGVSKVGTSIAGGASKVGTSIAGGARKAATGASNMAKTSAAKLASGDMGKKFFKTNIGKKWGSSGIGRDIKNQSRRIIRAKAKDAPRIAAEKAAKAAEKAARGGFMKRTANSVVGRTAIGGFAGRQIANFGPGGAERKALQQKKRSGGLSLAEQTRLNQLNQRKTLLTVGGAAAGGMSATNMGKGAMKNIQTSGREIASKASTFGKDVMDRAKNRLGPSNAPTVNQ